MFNWNTKCVACAGQKYLQGLELTKCFPCLGVGCNFCEEKGATKGLWSMYHWYAGKGEHGRLEGQESFKLYLSLQPRSMEVHTLLFNPSQE